MSIGKLTPARRLFSITPSDTADLALPTRALNPDIDGVIKVDTVGGDSNVTLYVKAGLLYPIEVKRVYASGTTVTNLMGLA